MSDSAVLTIGDTSRDGYLEITDTRWDSNGTMFVTVRELIGGKCWNRRLVALDGYGYPIHRARRLAKQAIAHPELTRSARVVNRFTDAGCDSVTFAVSRLG